MLRERAFAMDLDDLHLLLKAFNKRGRIGKLCTFWLGSTALDWSGKRCQDVLDL